MPPAADVSSDDENLVASSPKGYSSPYHRGKKGRKQGSDPYKGKGAGNSPAKKGRGGKAPQSPQRPKQGYAKYQEATEVYRAQTPVETRDVAAAVRYSSESESDEDRNIAGERDSGESEDEMNIAADRDSGESEDEMNIAADRDSHQSEDEGYLLPTLMEHSLREVLVERQLSGHGHSPTARITYPERRLSPMPDEDSPRASPRSNCEVPARSLTEMLSKIVETTPEHMSASPDLCDSEGSGFILGGSRDKSPISSPTGWTDRMGHLYRTSGTPHGTSEVSSYDGNEVVRAAKFWKPFLRNEQRKRKFGSTEELMMSARDDDAVDAYPVFSAHPVARAVLRAAEETGFDPSGFDVAQNRGLTPVYDQSGIFAPPTGQKYEVKLRRPTFAEFEQQVSQVPGVSRLSKKELHHVFENIQRHQNDARLTRSKKLDVLKDMMESRYGLDRDTSVTLFAVLESLCGKYYGSFDPPFDVSLKNVDNLLLVQRTHGQARQNGLRKGDILVSINSTLVGNMPEQSAYDVLNYLTAYSKYPVVLHWIRAHFTLRANWVPPQTQEERAQHLADTKPERASLPCAFVIPDTDSHISQRNRREPPKDDADSPPLPKQFRYDLRQRIMDMNAHQSEAREEKLEQPTPTSFNNMKSAPIDFDYLVDKCERSGKFSPREINFLHGIARNNRLSRMQRTANTDPQGHIGDVNGVADASQGGSSRIKHRPSDRSVAKLKEDIPSNTEDVTTPIPARVSDISWEQYVKLIKSLRNHPVSPRSELSKNRERSRDVAPSTKDNRSPVHSKAFSPARSKVRSPVRSNTRSREHYSNQRPATHSPDHSSSRRPASTLHVQNQHATSPSPHVQNQHTTSPSHHVQNQHATSPSPHVQNQHATSPSHIPPGNTTTNVSDHSPISRSRGSPSPARTKSARTASVGRDAVPRAGETSEPSRKRANSGNSQVKQPLLYGALSPLRSPKRTQYVSRGSPVYVKRWSGNQKPGKKRSEEFLEGDDLRKHKGMQTAKVVEYDGWVPPNRFTTPRNSVLEESCCFSDHVSGRLERNNKKLLESYCQSCHENLVHDELERYHNSVADHTKPAPRRASETSVLSNSPDAGVSKISAADVESAPRRASEKSVLSNSPDADGCKMGVADAEPTPQHVPAASLLTNLPDADGCASERSITPATSSSHLEPEEKIPPSIPILVDMCTQTYPCDEATSGARCVASPALLYATASKDYLVSPRDNKKDQEEDALCAHCYSPMRLKARSPTLPNKPVSPMVRRKQNDAATSPRATQEKDHDTPLPRQKEEPPYQVMRDASTSPRPYVDPVPMQPVTLPYSTIPHNVDSSQAATDGVCLDAKQFYVQWRPYVPLVDGVIPGTCFGTFHYPCSANTKLDTNNSPLDSSLTQNRVAPSDGMTRALNLSPPRAEHRQLLHDGAPLIGSDTVRGRPSVSGKERGCPTSLFQSSNHERQNDAPIHGGDVSGENMPLYVKGPRDTAAVLYAHRSNTVCPPTSVSYPPNAQVVLPRDGHRRSSVVANAMQSHRQRFTSPPSYLANHAPQSPLPGYRLKHPHRPALCEVDIDVVTPR